MTLVAIVFFFLIGEVPTHFVSRKTAATILFNGDETKANNSRELEVARQIFTVLNAVNIAINFILYCLLFPPFRKALINKKPKVKTENLQVNIFLIDTHQKNNLNVVLPIKKFIKTIKDNNPETSNDSINSSDKTT